MITEGSTEGSADLVRASVARVLNSQELLPSKRLQRFLSYIVEETLAGRAAGIKEYTVALAVFDRDTSFDSRTDNIVRVEARRLRQQLANYYIRAGDTDPVMIELPKGGYAPVFHHHPRSRGQTQPRKRTYLLAAILAAFVMLLAAGLWTRGTLSTSRAPSKCLIEGSDLKVLDAEGRVCWEKRFAAFHKFFGAEVTDKTLIADIDDDGRKEVLFNYLPDDERESTGSLLCFESGGKLRWEFRYGAPKTFGTRKFEVRYRGRLIRPVRIGGRPYLVAVANHNLWYPAQVALLDVHTGRLVEEYWHPGSIYQSVLRDIDDDGQDELLLTAINNPGDGPGHTGLIVLKLPFSQARGHEGGSDELPALTGGGELAYLLFPNSDVFAGFPASPSLALMGFDGQGRILVESSLPEAGGIVYYLDREFQVTEYRISDNFAGLHERMFRQHFLDHRLTAGETASLGRAIRFRAAPDGNSPELRRFWLASTRR